MFCARPTDSGHVPTGVVGEGGGLPRPAGGGEWPGVTDQH